MTSLRWKDDPARRELLALFAEADALLAAHSCDASTDCCHFGRTGREPYPTAVEVAELEHAIAAAGGFSAFSRPSSPPGAALNGKDGSEERSRKGRRKGAQLPIYGAERRCPMLSSEGRCRIYASRPLGCRTFFCDRVQGGKVPRERLQAIGRRVAELSTRTFVRNPGPRTLESALEGTRKGETVRTDRAYVVLPRPSPVDRTPAANPVASKPGPKRDR